MIKKITLIAALLLINKISAQTTFDWETATVNDSNQVVETINNIRVTFTGAPNAGTICDLGCPDRTLLSTHPFNETKIKRFTFNFNTEVDVNEITFSVRSGGSGSINATAIHFGTFGTPLSYAIPVSGKTTLTLGSRFNRVFGIVLETPFDSVIEFDSLKVSQNSTLSTEYFNKESNLKVYPNPVKNNLHIDYSLPIESVEIFNILGKLVHTSINKDIDFTNYINGVYFIKIRTEKGIITKKIIKK